MRNSYPRLLAGILSSIVLFGCSAKPDAALTCAAISYHEQQDPFTVKVLKKTYYLEALWFLDQLEGDRQGNVDKMKEIAGATDFKILKGQREACSGLIPHEIRDKIADSALDTIVDEGSEFR